MRYSIALFLNLLQQVHYIFIWSFLDVGLSLCIAYLRILLPSSFGSCRFRLKFAHMLKLLIEVRKNGVNVRLCVLLPSSLLRRHVLWIDARALRDRSIPSTGVIVRPILLMGVSCPRNIVNSGFIFCGRSRAASWSHCDWWFVLFILKINFIINSFIEWKNC